MIFYQVQSEFYSEEGVRYFATKAEALAAAKEAVAWDQYATVHRVGLRDTKKATILALANNDGWAAVYEEIWAGEPEDAALAAKEAV